MKTIQIVLLNDHPTIRFAASELARYLMQIAQVSIELIERIESAQAGGVIQLGLVQDVRGDLIPAPESVNETVFDDAIRIAVHGTQGQIVGTNPRSVLLATYRYLHMLGCRWARPGLDGEYLPTVDLAQTQVHVAERPSYRHRGICIEGAVSFEHVRDIIDWMPKVGLNAYFVQFREAFTFFDRWYSHRKQLGRVEPIGTFRVEEARELVRRVAAEAKLRDLIYQAVGHGWTCEPFGMAGLGWEYPADPVPAAMQPYLALVNGKRELWEGIPLNTSLCFSNPDVRQIMTDAVVTYAREHPEIDILHVWLDDGSNNMCECEACRNTRPSDYYVMLLNEIDAKLTAQQLNTPKIVFLAYFDLLWPPEQERLQNLDRFILMFAPITRTYTTTFASNRTLPALPPYERNRLQFPKSVEENLAFLRAWQAQCTNNSGIAVDSFDFDYHLMWDHYRDPAGMQIAQTLHGDLQQLHTLGLNGFISCQVQRACFPTGLAMATIGWATWDVTRSTESILADYVAAAFGPEGELAARYLTSLSQLFDPPYLRGEKPVVSEQAAQTLAQVADLVAQFSPTIAQNITSPIPCWSRSWHYLHQHGQIAIQLAAALRERALGHTEAARISWESLEQQLWQMEDDLHPVLDVFLATGVWRRWFVQ